MSLGGRAEAGARVPPQSGCSVSLTLRLRSWHVQVLPVFPEWEASLLDVGSGFLGRAQRPSTFARNREPWGPQEGAVPALIGPTLGPAGGGPAAGGSTCSLGPAPPPPAQTGTPWGLGDLGWEWCRVRVWAVGDQHSQPALTLPLPSGSMYDGLADSYNNYGTTTRSSYYSKLQMGNGSWGYPVRAAAALGPLGRWWAVGVRGAESRTVAKGAVAQGGAAPDETQL